MNCKNCGQELTSEQAFCPMCGEKAISYGGFVQPERNNIVNSETINTVRPQSNSINKAKKKRIGIIAAVVVAVTVVLIVLFSIVSKVNTCAYCKNTYIGEKHLDLGDVSINLCDDCYRNFLIGDIEI